MIDEKAIQEALDFLDANYKIPYNKIMAAAYREKCEENERLKKVGTAMQLVLVDAWFTIKEIQEWEELIK